MFDWLKGRKRGEEERQSPGGLAVKYIAETWMVDNDSVRWVDGGFDWWPGSFRVEVRCFEDATSGTNDRWRVSVSTAFVDGLAGADPKVARFVALFGQFAPSYSLVYKPAASGPVRGGDGPSSLYLFSSAYVSKDLIGWLPKFLARMALLQPINAEIQAEFQAETLGGRPSFGERGKVSELDEVLEVISTVYAPAGDGPSWWYDSGEFEDVAHLLSSQGQTVVAQPDRLVMAALFGTEPMLVMLRADVGHPQWAAAC